MHGDIEQVRYSKEDIQNVCKRLGEQISEDYKKKKLLIIGILKGSFIFMADLARNIQINCEMDFLGASSYYGKSTDTSGVVTITKELESTVQGYDVLLVEDIVDTGNTLYSIKQYLEEKGAQSVKICSLFDKPSRRIKNINADYVGFTIKNEFIVGYGLDFDEKYRNLPYVGILKSEVYE